MKINTTQKIAWIFASVLIIISIILTITVFIHQKPFGCSTKNNMMQSNINTNCNYPSTNDEFVKIHMQKQCNVAKQMAQNVNQSCKNKRPLILLLGLILLPIGLGIIWLFK